MKRRCMSTKKDEWRARLTDWAASGLPAEESWVGLQGETLESPQTTTSSQ